jgi:hypothetical protein
MYLGMSMSFIPKKRWVLGMGMGYGYWVWVYPYPYPISYKNWVPLYDCVSKSKLQDNFKLTRN